MVVIIDPQIAGISGDMILSALIDLGADKSKIIDGIRLAENHLHGSSIKKIDFKKVEKHGIEATELFLDFNEEKNERKGSEIKECIEKCLEKIELSKKAKLFAVNTTQTLINVESKIHGVPLASVHFHEASSIDTVVDILGTTIALDDLHFFDDEIITTSVAIGGGTVTFSHGTTSNPAFAILEIFKNSEIVISGGQTKEELTTPTGASLLVNLTKNCLEFYPPMKIKSIGYGAGKKSFDGFSNILKIVQGEKVTSYQKDSVQVLETNLDDISGEVLGHLVERLMSNGAKDVTIAPAITKKGRPTNLVTVICSSDSMNELIDLLISETGTLGVRIRTSDRYVVPRSTVSIPIQIQGQKFTVRCKKNTKYKNFKIESDDIKFISDLLNKPFKQTEELIKLEINKNFGQ